MVHRSNNPQPQIQVASGKKKYGGVPNHGELARGSLRYVAVAGYYLLPPKRKKCCDIALPYLQQWHPKYKTHYTFV
jgi:hypothetical protein